MLELEITCGEVLEDKAEMYKGQCVSSKGIGKGKRQSKNEGTSGLTKQKSLVYIGGV